MEVKINREIRNYTESMFFGLSLRQFIFSVLACAVAAGLYFLLKPYLGTETVSWVCILGAAPFAALGFVKYNGMTAEKFIWAWIKSEFLMPKKLVFHSTNTYYELMKPTIEQKQKEAYKNNDYCKANSERNKPISDWEEWQANTLGAAILLPENLIKQGMYLFSLGEKIECLNKIYYPSVYKRFDALADFLGCSKKALAIRMKQLGLLKKEYLDNPFDLVTVYPEVSEL